MFFHFTLEIQGLVVFLYLKIELPGALILLVLPNPAYHPCLRKSRKNVRKKCNPEIRSTWASTSCFPTTFL